MPRRAWPGEAWKSPLAWVSRSLSPLPLPEALGMGSRAGCRESGLPLALRRPWPAVSWGALTSPGHRHGHPRRRRLPAGALPAAPASRSERGPAGALKLPFRERYPLSPRVVPAPLRDPITLDAPSVPPQFVAQFLQILAARHGPAVGGLSAIASCQSSPSLRWNAAFGVGVACGVRTSGEVDCWGTTSTVRPMPLRGGTAP